MSLHSIYVQIRFASCISPSHPLTTADIWLTHHAHWTACATPFTCCLEATDLKLPLPLLQLTKSLWLGMSTTSQSNLRLAADICILSNIADINGKIHKPSAYTFFGTW